MKFKLEFNCDNAAFEDLEVEIARLLQVAAQKVEEGNKQGILLDSNGNLVGKFSITGRR
jgi:hypothetical protein